MLDRACKAISVLIADDQRDILSSSALLFKSESIVCTLCDSPAAVVEQTAKNEFDVILLDMNFTRDTTSGKEGLSLIELLKREGCDAAIVAMTAWATVDIAVDSMKLGAKDFITKPWENERLLSIIRTQAELRRTLKTQAKLAGENAMLRAQLVEETDATDTYQSPKMRSLMTMLKQVSAADARLLIMGENGTGKSMIARQCHTLSLRSSGPFISVNMGGLADTLFESEIFGHEKGAFTGAMDRRIGRYELADGGTLFLDEIANLGEKQQAVLLRLLETGEFERVGSSRTYTADVRIICATNENIQQKVEEGAFREDLFYRINTVPIVVPPLRERIEDIALLAEVFIEKYRVRYHRPSLVFSDEAIDALTNYHWPGNVRELDHAVERGVLLSSDNAIQAECLSLDTPKKIPSASVDDMTLDAAEAYLLKEAIKKYSKQPDAAAEKLGISRSALYRKLKKYGFELT